MKITRVTLLGPLFAALLVTALSMPAAANLSITVQPLVSELSVAPGGSGHVKVLIKNSGTAAERIIARPVDWRTLSDGSTTLERPGAEGDSSITRFLSLSAYQFDLQPEETRELALTLEMPGTFSTKPASYWGGYLVSAAPVVNPSSAIGVAATVFVYQNINKPRKHMQMKSMHVASAANGTAKLVAHLQNDGQGYCRSQSRLLIQQSGRIVREDKVTFPVLFPGASRTLTQNIDKLPPGDYQFELTFDYGGSSILDGVTRAQIK
ncbi:MAG: hypothetical protein DLM53_12350 [Candidatus Eremiobacter antarcticus]|nr:hypothetical protein [Candidatus Eremiobacteraeota bacterium]MBC5808873.1 hypothetical protein [Candidatus Eremiobacteraeota bacterium]PZR60443.1 MAG: hypothetical protein DLM53_12350 [Candidatus Eremiobacter sp. RRmetagenome_bin22]